MLLISCSAIVIHLLQLSTTAAATSGGNALSDRFRPRRLPGVRRATVSPPPPWRPIGPGPADKPEVVAFYGEDATVAGHPEDRCTPSFWLDFPPDVVTTIIMQGWNDPWMVAYAHSHGIRVLQAAGAAVSGYKNTSGAARLSDPAYRAAQVAAHNASIRKSGLDGWGWDKAGSLARVPMCVRFAF